MNLGDSISEHRLPQTFFDVVLIDDSFMIIDSSEWPETVSFIHSAKTVNNIVCVNNRDECGIALIQQFNSATKDKIQKQYLLQVEENRNPYTLRSAICMNFALCRE
jgi:hypothetical protein